MDWHNRSVLITGGTGSLGRALIARILPHRPRRLIVLSRDELKQSEMRQQYPDDSGPMRYFIGDVRDRDRLVRAFNGVDTVIHAAALKQVPALEYNPREGLQTNIIGAQNVIDAAIDSGVKRVLQISTDKAVQPTNLYGATKMAAEKLMIQANAYAGQRGTRFAVVRYGNVLGSRGSIVPLFLRQREAGVLTITDVRMTRFWITMAQALLLIEHALTHMSGGEIFVPRVPSMHVIDLARAIAPECSQRIIGIRPGEKLHEILISEDEARNTMLCDGVFVIQPSHPWWHSEAIPGCALPDGWVYRSDNNPHRLGIPELQQLLGEAVGCAR